MLINYVQRYQISSHYSNPCIFQNLHLTIVPLSPLVIHPALLHVKHNRPPISVGIITVLGMMPKSANLGALGRERSRPVTGNTNSRLFFIHGRTSNTRFLVDTGAEVSVYPPSRFGRQCKSSNLTLQAANNTSVRTYGTKLIALNLGLRRSFKWVFIIADVQYPIIGINFLQCHKLLVDAHNKCLLDTVTHLQINILASSLQPPI